MGNFVSRNYSYNSHFHRQLYLNRLRIRQLFAKTKYLTVLGLHVSLESLALDLKICNFFSQIESFHILCLNKLINSFVQYIDLLCAARSFLSKPSSKVIQLLSNIKKKRYLNNCIQKI